MNKVTKNSRDSLLPNVNYDPQFISITKHSDNYLLSLAELSSVDTNELIDIITSVSTKLFNIKQDEKWFFFNRLNVPQSIRNQGIASILMQSLVNLADSNSINILNPISSSGDMSNCLLTKFYMKYGFELVIPGLLIRKFIPTLHVGNSND
jgi:predicted GNAT family acetyltransferase